MRKLFLFFLFFHLSFLGNSQSQKSYTSSEILLHLKKLNVLGSVLYVGAHPDDENNALLPYFAYEKLYRTAYLSLTRGDGGQNLIGDEQGVELGLIRTQELLAARKIDGAEQYFTRAYEFGYSKSSAEALRIWDREKILSDVVWVIRKYQPDVIIKRFPPDSRAGHGHHSASAMLADEAFTAAADPNRFPEQFKYGLKPWLAKRIMWNTFNFGGTNTTSEDQLKIDIGVYNSLLGKSYGELGGEARTMHKSQGEGRPRVKGQIYQYFVTTAGAPAMKDIMDGVNTTWNRLSGGDAVNTLINGIINEYKADQPELSVPALVKVYHLVEAMPADRWKNQKLWEVQNLVEACSGLYIEATSSQQQVVQGDTLRINILLNERKNINATVRKIAIDRWDSSLATSLLVNQNLVIPVTLPVPGDEKISQPYWLEHPLTGGTFEVDDPAQTGKAENDPSFEVSLVVNIAGLDFTVRRPVQYKVIDPVKGELYQPVAVLPRVEMNFVKDNFISVNKAPVKVQAAIRANGSDDIASITPVIEYSKNWKAAPDDNRGAAKINEKFLVENFSSVTGNTSSTEEIWLHTPENRYGNYTRTISYDHIPTITYFPKAKANLVKFDVHTVGRTIGYIVGAGDKVPQALEAMGYEIKYLTAADLTDENLKKFDAIITGIRAYNMYEYLGDKNDVLMRYVENGGNVIVQYLKSNSVGNRRVKAGPYPFTIDAGLRVTEEDAKVNFLLPSHPAFNYPNKITEEDFQGWVQERSTYQVAKADGHYQMLLAMNDKDEKQSNGSLAIAKYGKGNFVYASLVFFRQLPAGVPGAYRLMANLIALPKD